MHTTWRSQIWEPMLNNRVVSKLSRLMPFAFQKASSKPSKSFRFPAGWQDKIIFFLSFDCDTEKDARVVPTLQNELHRHGLKACFAVPGMELEKHPEPYRALYNAGHEFLNHGYQSHCHLKEETNEYISSFFYNQLPLKTWQTDVVRGHENIVQIFGTAPRGYRTPHFGSFQSVLQLSSLYRLLSQYGYRYSTSTLPLKRFVYGQVYRPQPDLWEFPLSGMFDNPFAVFDSWSIRFDPDRRYSDPDYFRIFQQNLDFALHHARRPYILNYYVDPSQVFDFDGFYQSLEYLLQHRDALMNPTYSEFTEKVMPST